MVSPIVAYLNLLVLDINYQMIWSFLIASLDPPPYFSICIRVTSASAKVSFIQTYVLKVLKISYTRKARHQRLLS